MAKYIRPTQLEKLLILQTIGQRRLASIFAYKKGTLGPAHRLIPVADISPPSEAWSCAKKEREPKDSRP